MRVGETLCLRIGPVETTWRVVGIAREAFSPGSVGFIPLSFIQQRHPGMMNNLRLRAGQIHDPESISAVKARSGSQSRATKGARARQLTARLRTGLGSISTC